MYKHAITLFLLPAILLSCNSNKQGEKISIPAEKNIIINTNEIKSLDKISDVFEPISFVELEVNDNSFIGYANKTIVLEDHIIIGDQKQKTVFIFDRTGKHLATYDKVGNGPGEIIELIDFCYDKDNQELFLLDISKITVIGFNGNHIRDIPLDIGGLKIAYSERLKNFHVVLGRGHPNLIGKLDKQGVLVTSYIKKGKINAVTSKKSLFKNKDEIMINLSFSDTIYSIEENKLDIHRYIDFDKKITDNQYQTLEADYSTDKANTLLPNVMSNINFYGELQKDQSIGIFHYQNKRHVFLYDERLKKHLAYNIAESTNDLTFESTIANFETVSPEGHLVSVLNVEELNEESILHFNAMQTAPKALKKLIVGKDSQNSNPIIMLLDITHNH